MMPKGMPRYFIEVRTQTTVYEDTEGAVYPHNDAALQGAERLAVELSDEIPEFNGGILIVMDEEGIEIGEFTIRPPDKLLQ